MANVTCESVWIRDLLSEFGFAPECPMRLYCNNQTPIYIAENLVLDERTKHIELDCHLVRQKMKKILFKLDMFHPDPVISW